MRQGRPSQQLTQSTEQGDLGPPVSGTGRCHVGASSASAGDVPELTPATIPTVERSGELRDSSTPHHFGRGRARSNGKTTAERMVVVVEAVVAGNERGELIGGEVVQA